MMFIKYIEIIIGNFFIRYSSNACISSVNADFQLAYLNQLISL